MMSLASLLSQRFSYSDMNINYITEKTQGVNQGNDRFFCFDVTHLQKPVLNLQVKSISFCSIENTSNNDNIMITPLSLR